MYSVIRPILFTLDAEKAHHLTVSFICRFQNFSLFLKGLQLCYSFEHKSLRRNLWGLEFSNALGIAAGLDKNAEIFPALGNMGFGFVEVGTITPRPQEGNPRPRLFRLKESGALLNRMGFNNVGAEAAVRNIEKNLHKKRCILGINIGKNKDTPNERASGDYVYCLKMLHPYADYFVINVSSPNTPGLRNLLDKDPLLRLLSEVQDQNIGLSSVRPPRPVLLKISPDMENKDLDVVLEVIRITGIQGVIATNTTLSRKNLHPYPEEKIQKMGSGGISGRPLTLTSRNVVSYLRKNGPAGMTIIGCGGIMNAEDAWQMHKAGADLIQIYTGLIYEGPGLIKKILKRMSYEGL